MDHYMERWAPLVTFPHVSNPIPQSDIDEFYRLLERAREYDRKNREPDCEMEEKKAAVKKIAEQLGVTIQFPEDEEPRG
jgi:hypothetical protein